MELWFPTSYDQLENLPPVQRLEQAIDAAEYHRIPVDTHSPLFTEALVDLSDFAIAGEPFYNISDGSNAPYGQKLDGSIPKLLVRTTIARMLQEANARLAPLGLELFVWDAYRPIETQGGIWAFFENLQRQRDPLPSEDEIYSEVIKYVSDPRSFDAENPLTWPTHMTGASIDLTLREKGSLRLLDMGGAFDQMDETSNTGYYETLFAKGAIGPDHRGLLHRRLLFHAMAITGFTNYPFESWHFDWGNQMNSLVGSIFLRQPAHAAGYGIVTLD